MFVVEYSHEFCELYTTPKNKNREDIGVVASERHVDSWIDFGVIVSLLQVRFCCSKPTSVPSSAIDSWPTTVIEELIIATE